MIKLSSDASRAYHFMRGVFDGLGTTRKYTGLPYFTHCEEVGSLLRDAGWDRTTVDAGLLHDVVEDSAVTLDQIQEMFGADTRDAVAGVTNIARPEDGSRAVRARINAEHVLRAGMRSRAIKLADIVSNCGSIVTYDPKFARRYLAEKAWLLPHIERACPVLGEMARITIEDRIEHLERLGMTVDLGLLDSVVWDEAAEKIISDRDMRVSEWA